MNPFSALKTYFESAKVELEKVSWPSKEQTTRYSLAIIITSLVAALSFSLIDRGLHAGVIKLISLRSASTATVSDDQAQTVTPDITVTTSTATSPSDNGQVQLTPQVTPIIPTAPAPSPKP